MNYTLSDAGDRFVITPRCYFDTKGSKAKVKLDKESGRISVRPKNKPRLGKQDYASNTTNMIFGGTIKLPKKADLDKDPIVRHEGPVGQLLVIEIMKQVRSPSEPGPVQCRLPMHFLTPFLA